LAGFTYPVENSLVGRVFATGQPVLIGDATAEPSMYMHLHETATVGPVMILPLAGTTANRGALSVGRLVGRHAFDEADLDMAQTFADQAAVALELADARKDQQRMVLLEDRDRIARDLHDHVIQRLFATGLTIQGIAAGLADTDRAERLGRAVDGLDAIIRQIRTSIFQLRGELGPTTGNTRVAVLAASGEAAETLGFEPHVTFGGPIDALVSEPFRDDLVAVVREALSNVARHARATSVELDLAAHDGELTLTVLDDGIGMGDSDRRSGLANLRSRAEGHGGSLTVESAPPPARQGTQLRWSIPLT
jgi:signal transduction histidine kinase